MFIQALARERAHGILACRSRGDLLLPFAPSEVFLLMVSKYSLSVQLAGPANHTNGVRTTIQQVTDEYEPVTATLVIDQA